MKELMIAWEETNGRINYQVNGISAGEGDHGFDEIIGTIKKHPELESVVLKMDMIGSGGKNLEQSLPFAGRYHELKEALGGRELVVSFF